ncbi:MAG: ATP-binding protein [Proteobacteria bacterium]|nr:ATP-binding protein [Pseudomonadota bacterium]
MRKKVFQVKIKNFKAFQLEQSFNIKGKNVLIYGNNGSGKSSLFWALYTLTQSSIKKDEEIQKYFRNFKESDKGTHQSLRNVFTPREEKSFIELTTIDENSKKDVYRISDDIINTNKTNDTIIQELNQASDFINYKLLHNFYAATHKQEVNLWPVFERDIFPFLIDDTTNSNMLEKIKTKTSGVERYKSGQPIRGKRAEAMESELAVLNSEIESLLSQIQVNANDFIKKHFFDNKDVIRLALQFTKKFSFEKVKNQLWEQGKEAERHSGLHIKLTVEIFQEASDDWKAIHRVQSFLNEAQLTRIAIGIRIGALRTRVQTTDFKILVLDDMLISLDMSNRMPIIKMVLNQNNDPDLHFFDEFQKIILTHDKGFYELIKRQTSSHLWEYYNFHVREEENSAPIIKKDRTHLEKAQVLLADGEYDACGSELRKETEVIIGKYLSHLNSIGDDGKFEPLANKLNHVLKEITETSRKDFAKLFVNKKLSIDLIKKLATDFNIDGSLEPDEKGQLRGLQKELIAYLIKQYELKENIGKLIEDLQSTLKRIMNPASHSSFTPLYESELKDALIGVQKLKQHLEAE